MMKKWLIGLLVSCQLFGCSTNDESTAYSTVTPELTTLPTVIPMPTPTTLSTFDPYDVQLRHSPLDTLNYLRPLDSTKYYSLGEDPGKNFVLAAIYDFDNWIIEGRLYTFEDKSNITPEELNSKDYMVTTRTNFLLSTVDTYKDDYTHIADATCHLDYENSTYYPDTEECALEYKYNDDFKVNLIVNAVLSYRLGDTFEEVVALSDAVRNDPELQDKWIKAIFEYFEED